MANIAKWLIGGLGWAMLGPIGGLIGFIIGSAIDGVNMSTPPQKPRSKRQKTTPTDFSMSLLVLAAAVMKSDKNHRKSELNYIKDFLVEQYGVEKTKELLQALKKMMSQDIPVRDVSQQIRYYMEHSSRLQLLHFLFGIARADDEINSDEQEILQRISNYLGISKKDYESIKAMFIKSLLSPYKVLQIPKDSTNDDVKMAYRKMAKKYHPDKLNHLGEDAKLAAEEKFKEVQEAYEDIKMERGIR